MSRRIAAWVAVCAVAGVAAPAAAPAKQPPDEPLSPFYAAPAGFASKAQGTLLRSEAVPAGKLLPGARSGRKVLYVSRGHDGAKVVVSGLVYTPAGRPPKGGWPVVSYAHGTVGVVNRCAPSHRHDLPPFLGEYLKAGFAFAATDYEGLGPAGPHPYLHGMSEAHGQIDIVRAARKLDRRIGTRWMAVGQSQGGQATLFTAAHATRMAPELDYRGAIATAPPSHWGIQVAETTDTGRVLTPIVLDGLSYLDDAVDPAALVTEDGRRLLDAFHEGCLADTVLGLFPELIGKPLTTVPPTDAYPALKPVFDELEPPVVELDRPVLIAQGSADEFVPPRATRLLVDELRAKGSEVTFREFPDVMHRPTAEHALALGIPYARKLVGLSPYARLELGLSERRPGRRSAFTFASELPPPPAGFGSPALRRNEFRFPKGTKLDPGAVPACDATDEQLATDGLAACPAASRIGRGSADVLVGAATELPLAVTAFNARDRRLAVVLTTADGAVIRVLRPVVRGTRVRTLLPKVALADGQEASLTRFQLRLQGGTAKRPLIRTPAACPKAGAWEIAYVSSYDAPLGTERFAQRTPCARR